MKKKHYLELTLKEEIVEGRPEYSFFSRRTRTAFHDVLEILHHAANSHKVVALSLTLDNLMLGWARLSNLRRALTEFRDSGKPIYCFIESGGNSEYYLASSCNYIFMPPAASLHLVGLASEVFFFRDILDRFGVEAQIHGVGEFKTAGEMFTRTGMSLPSREQLNALLDDYYEEFCGALSGRRGLSRDEVIKKINDGPYSPREGVAQGLLDGICYQDEVVEKLKEKLGQSLRPLPAHKCYPHEGFCKRVVTGGRPRIAIINILGNIVSGESRRDRAGRHVAGAETIGSFLDHARKSSRVRAVVVRLDSPGGTALAADSIWRKMSILCEAKPVVVSFGDIAASGGYYIAAPAARILAEPTSITGSIGVLAGKFIAKELMNRLTIYRESIRRGEHAEFHSPFTSFSQAEYERLTQQMCEFYRDDFVKKVAAGRNMAEEAVDQVGRGRIWSGARARKNGLVDSLGGLMEAIQAARQLAGIPEKRKIRQMYYYPRRRFREMFIPEFTPKLHMGLLPQPAAELLELLAQFGKNAILLWMPFRIRIR